MCINVEDIDIFRHTEWKHELRVSWPIFCARYKH